MKSPHATPASGDEPGTVEASPGGKYQLSTRGIVTYTSLWAAIFGVVSVLAKHSSIGVDGPYPYTAGLVTDFLLPVAIGLVVAAIGVAVAFLFGQVKQFRAVAVWCFVFGYFAIPMLWLAVVVMAWLGLLSID